MYERLEQLLQATSNPPTRRAVMRGLAGVLTAGGLGIGLATESDAGRRNRRRRRRRRRQCNKASQCETPLNPCQQARCKKHRCKTRSLPDGTVCGDGLVCQNGACLCPNGVCTVRVTPNNRSAWYGLEDCSCGSGWVDSNLLTFRSGPGSPPYGPGSVELTAEDDSEFYALGTYQFQSTRLSQITAIEYSTFQPDTNVGTDFQVGVLQFGIDFFGSNELFQGRLVYVPQANGYTPAQNTWQVWDAIDGGNAMWFYVGGYGIWPDSEIFDDEPMRWADIVAKYPEARINFNDPVFAIEITGNGDDPFTEAINSVTFGTTNGTTRFVFGPA